MATWYIASTTASPAGNDANAGTSSALPKATIAAVHTAAASGDTVIVKASTGTVAWTNQTFTKNLTIQGESVPVYNPVTKAWTGAIFDGSNTVRNWDGSVSITLTGLVFRNAQAPASGYSSAIFSFSTFTFERCILYDILWSSFLSFRSFVLINYAANRVITVRNSIFYAPKVGSGTGAPLVGSWIGDGSSSGSVTITNCVVYVNGQSLAYFLESPPLTIKNNIFINTGSSLLVQSSSTPAYSNNIANGSWSSIPSGSNNLTSDPLFVDPANGDFRLRPSSLAVNSGVAL